MAAPTNMSLDIFDSLLKQLSALTYAKSSNDRALLKTLLDRFNGINYSSGLFMPHEKSSLAVNQLCFLASYEDGILVPSVLNLFQKLISQQNICLEGRTLTVTTSWVLNCVKTDNLQQTNLALQVLCLLIQGKCSQLEKLTDKILITCRTLMKTGVSEDPPQTFYNCLNCITSLCAGEENYPSDSNGIDAICDIYFDFLYNRQIIKNVLWQSKCLISAIQGLDSIVRKSPEHVVQWMPNIMGVVKGYMVYHIVGYEGVIIEKVASSNMSIPVESKTAKSDSKPIGKYSRKSKKKELTLIVNVAIEEEKHPAVSKFGYVGTLEDSVISKRGVTSESDFSEGESGSSAKLKSVLSKVRKCAFILLGSLLLKGDTRVMVGYLPSILPDGSPTSQNVVSCILKDPSFNCRTEILLVLSVMFKKFKQFFMSADSLANSSFTTLAHTVAVIIKDTHSCFINALRAENYKAVTMHILKVISDLIRCTPYHKLNELLTSLAKEVAPFLRKSDIHIQIAALVVFGCITATKPRTPEIKYIVMSLANEESAESRPWLLNQCLYLLTEEKGCNSAVGIECLQVLAALVRSFPCETLVSNFQDIARVTELTSLHNDHMIRFYAAKFTEAAVESLQTCVSAEDESSRISPGIAAKIWSKIAFPAIASLMQSDEQGALRAVACDCLTYLSLPSESTGISLIFDELPRQDQIVGITHLFGCAKDENTQTRCSAIRSLAAFVKFPQLREDELFFLDAIDLFFTGANDSNVGVKVQAAWLLSHLTEASLTNKREGIDEYLTESMFLRLLQAAVTLATDVKKGQPYAVRAIANLLSMASEEAILGHKEEVARAADALIRNASTGSFMKARWNACYALGKAMENPLICQQVRSKAFPVLFQLLQNYKNFKVRISAGQALSSLPTRESYGDLYVPTWQSLLAGLEDAENITDFSEYKHREHLVDQICSAQFWLTSLITSIDLCPVQQVLLHHIDLISHHIARFKSRVVPEKGSVILKAETRLSELISSDSFNREQNNALALLSSTFMSDRTY